MVKINVTEDDKTAIINLSQALIRKIIRIAFREAKGDSLLARSISADLLLTVIGIIAQSFTYGWDKAMEEMLKEVG